MTKSVEEKDRSITPLHQWTHTGDRVLLECANRHRAYARFPTEPNARRLVEHRVAMRGAQMHAQRERRASEQEEG